MRVGALVQTDESSDTSSPFRDRGPLEDSSAIRMLMEGELDLLGTYALVFKCDFFS